MGLGLSVRARRIDAASEETLALEEVAVAFIGVIADPMLREFATWWRNDDRVCIALHPAEEEVELFWREDDLWCYAKTSSCGPGYHAYLVETLERLAGSMSLEWVIDESTESIDETGYWESCDFTDLQREMAILLRAICKNSPGESSLNLMFALPVGFPTPIGMSHKIMTPLGFRTGEWLEEVGNSDEPPVEATGAYFSWWNEGVDAEFWKRYALGLCWTSLNWNVPVNEAQRQQYERTLMAFRRARALDEDIELPEEIIDEISMLLSDQAVCEPYRAVDVNRIGYFRHDLRRGTTGSWTVVVPGYWHVDFEDEVGTFVCWTDGITFRFTSWKFEPKPGRSALDLIKVPESLSTDMEGIDDRDCDPVGYATISLSNSDNEQYWVLSGDKAHAEGRCHVTIAYDFENDRDQALEIWRSVNCWNKAP